jgi:hypothetical protein
MARSTRLALALVIVVAVLGGIWWWLVDAIRTGTMQPVGTADEAVATISTTMGGTIGAILAAGLVIVVALRRRGA